MAYNKKGYYIRVHLIREITDQYYEPENHAKCYKQVWKKYIYPRFGICYRSYLNYLHVKDEDIQVEKEDKKQLRLDF